MILVKNMHRDKALTYIGQYNSEPFWGIDCGNWINCIIIRWNDPFVVFIRQWLEVEPIINTITVYEISKEGATFRLDELFSCHPIINGIRFPLTGINFWNFGKTCCAHPYESQHT